MVKDSGAITKLKTLTIVRKVILRAGIKSLNLTRNPNREAVIAQAVGSTVKARCSHCSRGEGAFTECVQATVDGELLQGSCASCHANSTGARCSLRPPDRRQTSRKRGRSQTPSRHRKSRTIEYTDHSGSAEADEEGTEGTDFSEAELSDNESEKSVDDRGAALKIYHARNSLYAAATLIDSAALAAKNTSKSLPTLAAAEHTFTAQQLAGDHPRLATALQAMAKAIRMSAAAVLGEADIEEEEEEDDDASSD
ncbi:hypothetical protein PHISCL_02999 [Aspergillus sclerotialis]|uniref:Uncharacterized protein n=1 Tax=Aspergillus sclerotialis TaxID=2070753 RepID=A0A3A2ZZ81_9EURO|nr:hypothetical protein PHISCL_02999 [Aspergillus sclerotialis]